MWARYKAEYLNGNSVYDQIFSYRISEIVEKNIYSLKGLISDKLLSRCKISLLTDFAL